ncbi:L-rhamnose-binding lectin CSL3 [Halyomorpha halys]|uniref:L-rhamnose-binding lectin CSL3 n=1 Tax=Halyomorpha halys TaxID=286706 RepID=UPI0006D528BB|nr:L-rhamnose-binding lectin CSL3 [Halyomorpha halys]
MASCLVLQIFLAFLQWNIFFRDVRGLAEAGFVYEELSSISEDFKEVQRGMNQLELKTEGKWEAVCDKENLSISCGAGDVINIMDAYYGRNDRTTCASYPNFNNLKCMIHWDALYRVKQRCHNKRRCSIKSSTDEFGDPCPDFIKYLAVKYACEPVRSAIRESVTMCKSKTQQIQCQKGKSIMITDVLYGRMDNTTCCCQLMNDTNCRANNGLDIVSSRCDFKESCNLEASNYVFGDPCFGTIKYLTVEYLCLQDKVQHVRNCEGMEIQVRCEENTFIDVINAHYGRAHPFVCLNSSIPFLKQGCTSTDIKSSVKERCQGKSWCSFLASNDNFGDPCFGYKKYLDVHYSCNHIL